MTSMEKSGMSVVFAAFVAASSAAFAQSVQTSKTHLGGFAGRKVATLLEGRVYSEYAREEVMDEAVRAFETNFDDKNGSGSGLWQGEYWGRTMLGHTGAYRLAGDEGHRRYILRQAERLVGGFMREDGYLGTYSNPRFVKGGWNLWGRKYTMWGLVEAYEATGEKRLLDAASKTMRQIIDMLADMKLSIRETGDFNGVASCSILNPLVELYRHDKKPEFLAFMKSIVADWDRADGAAPNLIANAFSGKALHEWYPTPVKWAKTAEILNCYEGLVAYSELTGEKRPLEAAVRAADLLAAHEMNPMGSVGYYDHLTRASANANATIEMCDVMYWIRLCHALYRATGETRHLDRAENCFCNSYLAGLYECGRWGAYSVRAHGYRHGTASMVLGMRHHTCCVDNSPRAAVSFAENVACLRGGTLEVNHYLPARAELGGMTVDIFGNYPVSEDVRVEIVAKRPVKVALRVPGWCKAMSVDGRAVAAAGGRVVVDAPVGKSVFSLRFPMSVKIVHRADIGAPALLPGHECDGKGNDGAKFLFELPKAFPEMKGVARDGMAAYVTRGPLVLAKTVRLGESEKRIFAPDTINGDRDWKVSAEAHSGKGGGFWGRWELTFEKGGDRRSFKVCDFASAAPSDDWHNAFSIWF